MLNFVTSGARDEAGTEIPISGARQVPDDVGGHDRGALMEAGRALLALISGEGTVH